MILLCAGVGVMVALNALSGWKTRVGGAFVRSYPPHFLTAGRAINLGVNSYYFAGAAGADILLGNYTNPRVLLRVSLAKMDTSRTLLDFPSQRPPTLNARVSVMGPAVIATDGSQGLIFRGDTNRLWLADSLGTFDFNQACVFSAQTIGLRCYDGNVHQNVLSLYNGVSKTAAPRPGLLTRQVDGVFCTEGKLLRNATASLFVYVYLFRNEYLVLDSNMVLRYRGHTIDTNYTAKIKVQTLDGGARTQIAAPPVLVNRLAASEGGRLITVSEVLADNDPAEVLKDYGIADIYDLSNGKYEASFYLPKLGHKRLSDIWIYQGVLYAMEDEYLYSYALPAPNAIK